MPLKVLVFGGAGQVGAELVREFSERGHSVVPFDRGACDITRAGAVEQVIARADPDVVLSAAAYNMVDVAEKEPEAAYQVNGLAVRNIATACRQAGAALVHFSTDYVFDGMAGRPYTEQDRVHPVNAYGVSKLAGEFYARAYVDRCLVIRTCGVFGPGGLHTPRGNFVELMLRLAAGSGTIRVVEDHVASPTYAPLLAARTADLVERGETGVYHVAGGTPISWFDYARMIFRLAGLEPALRATNEREYRTAARRPKYSALSNAKMEQLGLDAMPPLETCVNTYLAERARLARGTAL